ncbi:tRNA 5-methoxyuridine(34)/uridine 5-oxyacetic acid(34) synthase CmoB [Kangiella sp. HZ709]|uniref:tRNA 5-methoxyuridine(34)/uridine 5-oxyacetic acid(34) synthase CmoB n=1 Tax=Kangiella sp. HZ709 TaxID=2666328 RepID=UPI0012AF408C|nr:tRNA 5-methoxyuridine(34)/uridine 5-oxyacetic acid(34) synthase CmoB [Kangiella sp. HZ709]MRX26770.1 tRNA 5-methoxyuridine(34)/uridine 5-oxyacetic acid(34) synthase CmoB [Kangiella sp. HZ709]
MFDIHQFLAPSYEAIFNTRLRPYLTNLKNGVNARMSDYTHGKIKEWVALLEQLPNVEVHDYDLINSVTVGEANQLNKEQHLELASTLKQFHPWRKGPFNLFGTDINTEWRSDWKWDRLKEQITSLQDKIVLDVGCGNGYHCWRMASQNPKMILGIDPSQLFLMQFAIMKKYLPNIPVHFLPIGIEYLPNEIPKQGFDTIFSMGVLYHRRSPIDHIMHLKKLLKHNGELILETLVIDGDDVSHPDQVLIPDSRYAQMNNVWFIPTVAMLTKWMERCNLKDIRCVDINQTTIKEQRATNWMNFQSLNDFLDQNNPNKTIEGHPAPKRAIMIATRK